jgi:hypothetical protein
MHFAFSPPDDLLARLATKALPPLNTIQEGPLHGFATPTSFDPASASLGGLFNLQVATAQRKIPSAVLNDAIRAEEQVYLKHSGTTTISRKIKAEIQSAVKERLLPAMPVVVTRTGFVINPGSPHFPSEATTDAKMDLFNGLLYETCKVTASPLTPQTWAAVHKKLDIRDFQPSQFGNRAPDDCNVGTEFLTWLWFFSETQGGMFACPAGTFGILIEGPLTLINEGQGAHVVTLKGGSPTLAVEAKSAMLGGKQLHKLKLTLARGQEVWSTNVDSTFCFSGLKLPAGEMLEPVAAFEERQLSLSVFVSAFYELYGEFLKARASAGVWEMTTESIRTWINERTERV